MKNLFIITISLLLVSCSASRKELRRHCYPGIGIVGISKKDVIQEERRIIQKYFPDGYTEMRRESLRHDHRNWHAVIVLARSGETKAFYFHYDLH